MKFSIHVTIGLPIANKNSLHKNFGGKTKDNNILDPPDNLQSIAIKQHDSNSIFRLSKSHGKGAVCLKRGIRQTDKRVSGIESKRHGKKATTEKVKARVNFQIKHLMVAIVIGAMTCTGLGCFDQTVTTDPTNIKSGQLVGTYQGDFPDKVSILVLQSNGQFTETLKLKSGKSLKGRGRWKLYTKSKGEQYLEMDGTITIRNNGKQGAAYVSYLLGEDNNQPFIVVSAERVYEKTK